MLLVGLGAPSVRHHSEEQLLHEMKRPPPDVQGSAFFIPAQKGLKRLVSATTSASLPYRLTSAAAAAAGSALRFVRGRLLRRGWQRNAKGGIFRRRRIESRYLRLDGIQ